MMQPYNLSAPKRPTNLSINRDLLAKARRLNLNLSATLESALADEVRKAERHQWLKKNKQAMESANRLVEKSGLFADSYRTL